MVSNAIDLMSRMMQIDTIMTRMQSHRHANEVLILACRAGRTAEMEVCLVRNRANFDLFDACLNNNLSKIHEAKRQGADAFGLAMWYAAYGGHLMILEYISKKMTTPPDWNLALSGASSGGQYATAQLVLDQKPTNLNACLGDACRNEHTLVGELLIECGATQVEGVFDTLSEEFVLLFVENNIHIPTEHTNFDLKKDVPFLVRNGLSPSDFGTPVAHKYATDQWSEHIRQSVGGTMISPLQHLVMAYL